MANRGMSWSTVRDRTSKEPDSSPSHRSRVHCRLNQSTSLVSRKLLPARLHQLFDSARLLRLHSRLFSRLPGSPVLSPPGRRNYLPVVAAVTVSLLVLGFMQAKRDPDSGATLVVSALHLYRNGDRHVFIIRLLSYAPISINPLPLVEPNISAEADA